MTSLTLLSLESGRDGFGNFLDLSWTHFIFWYMSISGTWTVMIGGTKTRIHQLIQPSTKWRLAQSNEENKTLCMSVLAGMAPCGVIQQANRQIRMGSRISETRTYERSFLGIRRAAFGFPICAVFLDICFS